MFNIRPVAATEFKDGDNVVLADGLHPGTVGVFLQLRPDVNWAEIRESNGAIRSHPVAWLRHSELPRNALS